MGRVVIGSGNKNRIFLADAGFFECEWTLLLHVARVMAMVAVGQRLKKFAAVVLGRFGPHSGPLGIHWRCVPGRAGGL